MLAWSRGHRRDLPWRHTRDRWAVLVSEVMTQQTQVDRVVPKYHAFLERFPTPAVCAAAPLGEVLRQWQGLGYPRRAKALHDAAAVIAASGFPTTVAGWMALPGVGPYTARAVLAFADEADVAVVDTNTARVLARWEGRRLSRREVQAAADAALVRGGAWEWNQAMLDLGAAICRPAPRCLQCPVAPWCRYRGRGPDPALDSAGVSRRQARFEGSDRQVRGRLMRLLSGGAVNWSDVAERMGCEDDPDRARRLVAALVADGLVVDDGDRILLPGVTCDM